MTRKEKAGRFDCADPSPDKTFTPSAMARFFISNGDSEGGSYLGRGEIPFLKSSDLPSEFSTHFLNSSTAFL